MSGVKEEVAHVSKTSFSGIKSFDPHSQNTFLYRFIDREFKTTQIEDRAMAPPATKGCRINPVKGYKTPAAIGMPMQL